MCASASLATEQLQTQFLALLPRIELHIRGYFRDIRCAARRDDCIAEAIALAWRWFVELAKRGKDVAGFPTVLAAFAARAVRCGRRVVGQEKAKDVLSRTAQRKHGFTAGSLPDGSPADESIWAEALRDNTQSAVLDQVCFRLDFPRWRRSHTDRDRRVIDTLLIGERTQEVARRFGLTESRISQLRRKFYRDWLQFHGEHPEAQGTPAERRRRSACPA